MSDVVIAPLTVELQPGMPMTEFDGLVEKLERVAAMTPVGGREIAARDLGLSDAQPVTLALGWR